MNVSIDYITMYKNTYTHSCYWLDMCMVICLDTCFYICTYGEINIGIYIYIYIYQILHGCQCINNSMHMYFIKRVNICQKNHRLHVPVKALNCPKTNQEKNVY